MSGSFNTAAGFAALTQNLGGGGNAAFGVNALSTNASGSDNTAVGDGAMSANVGGNINTAVGSGSLGANTSGSSNTTVGGGSLARNTTGGSNIAIGLGAGFNLTTGSSNIDIGNQGVAGESATIRIGDVQAATFVAGIRNVTVSNPMPVVIDPNGQLGTTNSLQGPPGPPWAARDCGTCRSSPAPAGSGWRYVDASNQ